MTLLLAARQVRRFTECAKRHGDQIWYRKHLTLKDPEELFEVVSQALLNAVDRDAYSGWGATVKIM